MTDLDLMLSEGTGLSLASLSPAGRPSLLGSTGSRLFGISINGRYNTSDRFERLSTVQMQESGWIETATRLGSGDGLEVVHHVRRYVGEPVAEVWLDIHAKTTAIRVTRVDSLLLDLRASGWTLHGFRSAWGREFEPDEIELNRPVMVGTRRGRSSKGWHPIVHLLDGSGDAVTLAVAWSGNWAIRARPSSKRTAVSAGLHDWAFAKLLEPGEAMTAPKVVIALGNSDRNSTSVSLARVGRAHWYPSNERSRALPVEWNHWFSYIDAHISDPIFRANVEVGARMGIEASTLDAGWFGPSDDRSFWYDFRGDWDRNNEVRFPDGIVPLAADTHRHGQLFGIWCEIEAVGKRAELAVQHPEFLATRRGQRLGYLCFGNPAAVDWAFGVLDDLIVRVGADWIKLDFNIDPRGGCDRTDHGHQAGDGLYEHYRGYYRLLDDVRRIHPRVILENCSSGGLRIDLELARHTHCAFLSDPDWPEHSLQVLWGASTMLAPSTLLHWGFCEWDAFSPHPRQTFDPHSPDLTPQQLDYDSRISMLGWFGFSQRLPDLPVWVAERFTDHIRSYVGLVRRFVADGDLRRLTGQPLRDGRGDRWMVAQYTLAKSDDHLIMAFRLPGGSKTRTIRLEALDRNADYHVDAVDGGTSAVFAGRDLMEQGLALGLHEEASEIMLVRRMRPRASNADVAAGLADGAGTR